ncbi:Hypothetical predicted protein [Lecanosticta acicola]|uniref:High-temperature-induced dauer-formation protein n=1 Tax=Lecanosticta acicola TaxID=111012 RepID=A0AAI8YSR2_9PEZI|nr:Hypothetical predicted protein [Lecanosticta acicola]
MGASDSKLAFKHSVFGLAGREDIPHSDPLWTEIYTLPESANDVFSLWSPNDIGCLTLSNKENHPQPGEQVDPNKNLETLLYVLIARLQLLQETTVYPDDPRAQNNEILNCMRIFTRVIPFIYEAEHLREWHDRFLWQMQKPTYFWDKKRDQPGTLFDGLNPGKTYRMEEFDLDIGPPLGYTLLELMAKFLFLPGFAIPARLDDHGNPDLECAVRVWQTGIGSARSLGCSKYHERNQQETVRLLVAISSNTMYIAPNEVAITNVKPLTYMTTRLDKRVVNGILCSLLNTVLKYNPNLWSVPIEMAMGSVDSKKFLVTNCLQLILVLMVYVPPGVAKNQFRQSMGSLHRADDFQFIQSGLNTVLAQPVSGAFNNPLNREKAVSWAPEMISFFWELVQCNRRFRRYLIDTRCVLDLMILVLFYAMDSKDQPSKHGVLRMCVLLLQTLSNEERFADKLNIVFRHPETLPPVMRIAKFHGSYGDFLLCSRQTIFEIFTTTKNHVESLFPASAAIVANILPGLRHLGRATSLKLMVLFERLSKLDFLMQKDSNKELVLNLMFGMNELVEKSVHENGRFVEALVAHRSRFRALREFTIDGALAESDRQAQERKERGLDASGIRSPASRTTSMDNIRGSLQGPQPFRPTSLDNVPEDGRFTIGDDDDNHGHDTDDLDAHEVPQRSNTTAASHAEGAEEAPERSLSEKARGKQPATATSTPIESTSRNTSTASLPALTQSATTPSQFVPTQEWLDSWHPKILPLLDNILKTIDLAETKQLQFKEPPPPTPLTPLNGATTPRPADADLPASSPKAQPPEAPRRPDGQSPLQAAEPPSPAPGGHPKIAFEWTAMAIGWYTALIWSRIYLTEAEAFQGSGGLFSSTNVLLFRRGREQVAQSPLGSGITLRSPRGAIDAVGDGILRGISSSVGSIGKAGG